ncbi:putative E3 ubiquitin-protein ligase HERC6 [Rhinophrynus dorsalis]
MYCWGDNSFGQLALPEQEKKVVNFQENDYFQDKSAVSKVACGGEHTIFLLEDGTIFSCGANQHGQLGRKNNTSGVGQIHALEAQTIVDVGCGMSHSVAVCSEGNVFTWGEGSQGQLGAGKFTTQNVIPKRIPGLSNIKIIQISCGHFHSVTLAEDGRVFSWGQNNDGQLGLGKQVPNQTSPQLVKSLKGIPLVQVTAGGAQSFALSMMGTVFAWGKNNAGQLGFKSEPKKGMFKPCAVSSLRNLGVVYISCGDEHTAVLSKDGSVYTFGDDTYGQLGQSSRNQTSIPQKIEEYVGQISHLACGSYHTMLYLFTSNRIVSFGQGSQRQQANAAGDDQAQPPLAFDSSSLVSPKDLMDIHVKWVFAGNDVSFAISSQQQNSERISLTDTLQKILRLDSTIVKKWMKAKPGSEEFQNVKREISIIFSSAACLTAGFLKHGTSRTFPVVDLATASDLFTELNKDKRISDIICSSLKMDLLPELESLPVLYEALSIFLLLPECPLMHDVNSCLLLVVPLSKAINNLSDNALKLLETLWTTLEASSLTKQIQMLKTAVMRSVLFTEMDPGTKDLLQMLKKLFKANKKAKCIVPISTFCIHELCPLIIIPVDINNWRRWQSQPEPDEKAFPAIYCRFPFIFNVQTKVQVLKVDSFMKKEAVKLEANEQIFVNRIQGSSDLPKIPIFHLKLRRSHLVEDTLHKLSIVEDCDLQKDLVVEFQGDGAADRGAVMREFFMSVFESLVDPEYGMFPMCDPSLPTWFPSTPLSEKKNYFYFGILCGLAIFNGVVVYLPFPLVLYKKLLGKKPTLDDLKELHPVMGRAMQEILDADNEGVVNMDLYFVISWENKTVNLIPNGESVRVDNSNKHDYVNRYIDYIFNTSVAETFEEFKRGLYKVCDKDIISFFHPEELMILVAGSANFDWNNFEKLAIYIGNYSPNHPTIKMFWKVFHALSEEQKKGFLKFLTGNDRFSMFGINNLRMQISSFGVPDEKYLPEAQTCFHILFLPEYSTIKTLKGKLLLAISNNKGFDRI